MAPGLMRVAGYNEVRIDPATGEILVRGINVFMGYLNLPEKTAETIGTVGEARKTGFNPTFLGSSAAYTDLIHKLGGKPMDGIYATMTVQNPYTDEQSQPLRFWANKYKTKFNEDPTVFSVYGYMIVQSFIQAANKAGPNLTTDSFIKAMDSSTFEPDMFGAPKMTFTGTKRLGNEQSRLSQIVDGKWKVVSDYVAP